MKQIETETGEFRFGDIIHKHIIEHNGLFDQKEMGKDDRGISAFIEENIRSAAPQLYHKEKTLDEIMDYTKASTDQNTKGGILLTPCKDIGKFNVPAATVKSNEPVIHLSWYHETIKNKEVFSIAWKLKLKS